MGLCAKGHLRGHLINCRSKKPTPRWPRGAAYLSRNDTLDYFLLFHPRVVFLKTLPQNSVVLDVGAGDGSLRGFRNWLGYDRSDLKFVGVSLGHSGRTEEYEEFHTTNLDVEKPVFKLQPNAVVAAQFIEHIDNPVELVNWLSTVVSHGSSLYFDWPSEHTVKLPPRQSIIDGGFPITTLNFFDDCTHKNAHSIEYIKSILEPAGFEIVTQGILSLPHIEESLKHYGIAEANEFFLSMAMWLRTGFVSYVSARKVR